MKIQIFLAKISIFLLLQSYYCSISKATIVSSQFSRRNLQSNQPEIKSISLNEYYDQKIEVLPQYIGSQDQNWQYFQLNVSNLFGESATNDEGQSIDLVIETIQTDPRFSDPNLYFMKGAGLPTFFNYTVRCSFYGEDICVISGSDLLGVDVLTIGVWCSDTCLYYIQAELTDELVYKTGKSHKLYFKAHQQRIVKFQIPDYSNISAIEVTGLNENKFAKFNMMMVKGNLVPTTENALQLRPAWENGYVGKFTDDCACFCRGCNYSVLISTDEAGYITLGAKISNQVVDLTSYKGEIFDSVLFFHTQWYKFEVKNSSAPFSIKMEVYSGDPDIYVNYNKSVQDLMQANFNSRDHFANEELILYPKDRLKIANGNGLKGTYYICVYGKTASSFKITVKNEEHSVFLSSRLFESGYLETNETRYYYYRDNILATPNASVEFTLHLMTGKARMREKLCQVSEFATDQEIFKNCPKNDTWMYEDEEDEKVMFHQGSESEKTNTSVCKLNHEKLLDNSERERKVSCVYIVGIWNMANYTSHYSVSTKVNKEVSHIVLKEGVPVQQEIIEVEPIYFRISQNDPTVEKVTIQMTTIHGDPDLFVSQKEHIPTEYKYDKRSIRCGIFPEIVQFSKASGDKLDEEFFIMVKGYVQSTFSLVYFLERENGQSSTLSLMAGKKMRNIMHSTNEAIYYKIKISSQFQQKIDVKLDSENGQFSMYLSRKKQPTVSQYQYYGDDHNPIVFYQQNYTTNDEFVTYFLMIKPKQLSIAYENQTKDTAGMAYVYTVAYYEQHSQVEISHGNSIKAQVYNDTMDFYFFEMNLEKMSDDEYIEIILTPISGNPDIVLSFDASNPFPDRNNNNFVSENNFSTDAMIYTKQSLKDQEQKNHRPIRQVYIGVYTLDRESIYTILVKISSSFYPTILHNGQIQYGKVQPKSVNYYYFKTSSLAALTGQLTYRENNPNLKFAIISNMSLPMNQWERFKDVEDFNSSNIYDSDIIYLSPNNTKFQRLCGTSCIVLIGVTNDSPFTAHYALTISRDIVEISENQQINGIISLTDTKYNYYKFYKACGDQCDLEIQFSSYDVNKMINLLVDFEVQSNLPSLSEDNRWQSNIGKYTNSFIIKANDSYFDTKSSKGMYYIAAHSYYNISYTLQVHTIWHAKDKTQSNQYIDIRKVYAGESQPVTLEAQESKYFFFENWINSSIRFEFFLEGQRINSIQQSQIDMRISTVKGKRLPQYQDEIPRFKWVTQKDLKGSWNDIFKDTIQVDYRTKKIEFCVQCYFIIRLENIQQTESAQVRLAIAQEGEDGYGFKSKIIVGKPFIIRLSEHQSAQLDFMTEETVYTMKLLAQIYYGKFKVQILDQQKRVISSYENEYDKPQYDQMENILPFKLFEQFKRYTIQITAETDLHASMLLVQGNAPSILSDGQQYKFEFSEPEQNEYFLYIPPSRKFHLTFDAQMLLRYSEVNVFIKKVLTKYLNHDVNETSGLGYWKTLTKQKDFDLILRSADFGRSRNRIFSMEYIELDSDDDYLFIKIEAFNIQGTHGIALDPFKGNLNIERLNFKVSGSEIQYLPLDKPIKGIVNNRAYSYKIYEFFINQNQLFLNGKTDLYIELTPCNGRVSFYVSDDFGQLFNNQSYVNRIDAVSLDKFGKTAKRIYNVGQEGASKVIYIGIESVNEIYGIFMKSPTSEFQLRASYFKQDQIDIIEKYEFGQNSVNSNGLGKEIQIVGALDSDKDLIKVKWSPIFERQHIYDSLTQVPKEQIFYEIILADQRDMKYLMGAQCQIDFLQSLSSQVKFIDGGSESKILLKKKVIEKAEVIGVLAYVTPEKGDQTVLAYEPLVLSQIPGLSQKDLEKKKNYEGKLFFIAFFGTAIVIGLALLTYCFKKRSQLLKRRLDYVVNTQTVVDGSQELSGIGYMH